MYDHCKIKKLHVMLSKKGAYVKAYDSETKWMYFMIEDNDFLEKHNNTLYYDNVSANFKKKLDRQPALNENIFFCWKPKQNLTVMKLQFSRKEILKFDSYMLV